MRFTLTQAAKEAGVSKGTVSKALKAGRLSGERQEDGSFQIEPVELFRVFPRKPSEPRVGTVTKLTETANDRPETDLAAALELAELRVKVTMLEDQLARSDRERETILERERTSLEDYRRRLDRAEERVLALTAQPPQPASQAAQEPSVASAPALGTPTPSRGFLARLLGR